jgi:cation transport ATPase
MMVLVAVAIGVGWAYSVAATFVIEGEVFYEAAAMLASFVLLGHWFEIRARGDANDAIRALLDMAPPMAVVIRDGEPVEVRTAEVEVGDLLFVRPGAKVPVDAEVVQGESEVDESTVTGDSLPVHKAPGDQLVGATINTHGTLLKMRQNLAWAIGYNSLALPIAGGVFEPVGFVLRPEVGAISMSGSSALVALNAVALKRLRLPADNDASATTPASDASGERLITP